MPLLSFCNETRTTVNEMGYFLLIMGTQKTYFKDKKMWIVVWNETLHLEPQRNMCKYEITVKWSILFLHYIHCVYVLKRPGNLKSLYWKNIHVVQTKWVVGFRNNSFGCTIIIFESCSSFKHFVGMYGENRHPDSFFHWTNFKCPTAVNLAKFERDLDGMSFSRELP